MVDRSPITPGEMLKEEFLAEQGLSQNQLAKAVGISPNRIAEIVNNRRRIGAPSDDVERVDRLAILRHMLETEVLYENEGVIGFGPRGEREFGRRHFSD